MKRSTLAAALCALVLPLSACQSGDGASAPSSPTDPGSVPTTTTQTPSSPAPAATPPPLGPDLACMDPQHCYLKNPRHLTDEQLAADLAARPQARTAPAPAQGPWAFVVLGLGEGKITGVDAPSTRGGVVTDEIGIINHRALFAFCRVATGGGAVTDATPRADIWYRIEPVTPDAPAQVWVNGAHLVPYLHDGRLPAC